MVHIGSDTWIFSDQGGQYGLIWFDVRSPVQCNLRPIYPGEWVARHYCQRAIVDSGCVCITTLWPVGIRSQLLESEQIARIQLNGALQVARTIFPMAFAAIDQAG